MTEVGLAGAVRIRVGDRHLTGDGLDWRATRRALAVLAVAQRPVTRDELAEVVWDGAPPATWDTALRGAISAIRKAVDQGGGPNPIRTRAGSYELDPAVVVDVVRAEAQISEAEHALSRDDPSTATDLAHAASAVLTQVFAAGEEGEWFDRQRRTLDAQARRALLLESSAATAAGRHAQAVAAAEAVVAIDPFVEAGHQRLMAAHEAAGQRSEAVRAYRRCRDLLAEELGVEPSEATQQAYRSLLPPTATERPAGRQPPGSAPVGMPDTLAHVLADGPRLCGRDGDLAALGERLGGRGPERSHLVLLAGPAGIGKSRLAAELAADAQRRGARVLHGRFEAAQLSPFEGLSAALAQAGITWPPPPIDLTAPHQGRLALAEAAAAPLAALVAQQRVLVVLDDLHWADRSALAIVGSLLDLIDGLTVVATRRTDVHNPALDDLLVEQGGAVWTHELGALDQVGVASLASAWAGDRPTPALVGWLHDRSGGNPLYAIRLLHGLDTGASSSHGRALPEVPATKGDDDGPGLADVLSGAWESIGPDARAMVELAAVIGHEQSVDLLVGAADLPASTVLARLDRAVRTGLLGQSPADPGRFHFVHQLVRDAVLAMVDPEALAALHRQVTIALLARPDAEPAAVVRHSLAADDADLLVGSVVLAARVARRLATEGAPERAMALLDEMAARLAADAPDATSAQARIHVAAVTAELTRNHVAPARAHLRLALELAHRGQDPAVLIDLAGALRTPEAAGTDQELIELVEGLLATCDPNTPERAVVLMVLSYELGRSVEIARSADLAAEAVEIGRRLLDSELLRAALHTWHDASRPIVHPNERRLAMEEAIALEQRFPSRHLDGVSWFHLANDLLELGDGPGARAALERCDQAMASGAAVTLRWLTVRVHGALAMAEGRWADAEQHLEASEALAASLGTPEALLLGFSQRMTLNQFRGDRTPYRELLAAVCEAPDAEPIMVCGAAFADAELGHPDAARSTDRAVDTALSMAPVLTSWPSLMLTAMAAAHVGHPAVRELADRLRPRSGCHVLIQAAAYLGPVDWVLGQLAAASGDLDAAVSWFEAAAEQSRALGARPFVARILAAQAQVHLQRDDAGDRARAEALATEVAALVADLDLEHIAT